jgi:MFS family permease
VHQRGFQVLFAGACLDMIAHSTSFIFTPLYLGELGAGTAVVGLVIGLSAFAFPVFILCAGSLLERVAPRRLIVATRGLVVVGLLVAIVASEWWQLAPGLVLIVALSCTSERDPMEMPRPSERRCSTRAAS